MFAPFNKAGLAGSPLPTSLLQAKQQNLHFTSEKHHCSFCINLFSSVSPVIQESRADDKSQGAGRLGPTAPTWLPQPQSCPPGLVNADIWVSSPRSIHVGTKGWWGGLQFSNSAPSHLSASQALPATEYEDGTVPDWKPSIWFQLGETILKTTQFQFQALQFSSSPF